MTKQRCYLVREEHIPARGAFPAIDAHNHLWGNWDVAGLVAIMDEVGVISYADLTANCSLRMIGTGYSIDQGRFEDFLEHWVRPYPGRFYGFTMVNFAAPRDKPLFDDAGKFVDQAIAMLHEHQRLGARGLKILKELGLHMRGTSGNLIAVDDKRLAPIWDECGKCGMPVLIHQGDPAAFFDPITPENEHYESLRKYPQWSFADPKFPRKAELLERRDNLLRRHPGTKFILAHVGNWPENLAYVSKLLDELPNVYVDFSARMDELGRQPYTAREFFMHHQDRIIFGTDMPASTAVYRCYFRFLETFDEYFFAPDYDGTFDRARWPICGIGLPREVLAKIYYKNILKIIPSLAHDVAGRIPVEE